MTFSETIFFFVLALIIFGPKKLPEIARQIGKYMNEFKRASNEFKAQIEQEIAHLEVEKTPTILPPASSPEGTASRTLDAAPLEASASESLALPAGEAAAEDEPLFATQAAEPPSPSTETAIPSETAAPTSQESHV